MVNEVIEMDEFMTNPIVRTHLFYFCDCILKAGLTDLNIHGSDKMFKKELASLDEEIETLTEYRRALRKYMKECKERDAYDTAVLEKLKKTP